MDKSNTNSEKIFDNNNENIKIIEKLSQIKLSDLSTIIFAKLSPLYLHHCSEFIIRQYFNVKSYKCKVKHATRSLGRQAADSQI